jgi:hypothetical protein
MTRYLFYCCIFLLLFGCSTSEEAKKAAIKRKNAKAEYILRHHNTLFFPIFPPEARVRELYSWEEGGAANLQRITKDFFRCKGSSLNIPILDNKDPEKPVIYEDCKGGASHNLPLIHGKEGVYPVLIDILNYLQEKTEKRLVITCGHRCLQHNKYSDRSKNSFSSKHMIGAEVDFYLQGMENKPKEVINLIFQFYKEKKRYGFREYEIFERAVDRESDVSTPLWFNKEIIIKLYKENEGRDFDNRHPYPYVSIQVKYDKDKKEKVVFSPDKSLPMGGEKVSKMPQKIRVKKS